VKSANTWSHRYGPWALIAGASEGIGRAFAEELARRGISLVIAARRREVLEAFGQELRERHGVEVRCLALDLAEESAPTRLAECTAELDLGLVIYNAAYSAQGAFLDIGLGQHERALAVNCLGPLRVSHHFGRRLRARGRGGLLLMSSMSGLQGTALVACYAATKAFNLILAEGLWAELREQGVDVLACIAGATRTPSFERSAPQDGGSLARPMEAEPVVLEALARLGQRPSMIPGRINRAAARVFRLLPRAQSVTFISNATRRMYGAR
jgi:short-subunit dehydrogenase